jgi:catechol 2,3-dioxygenase-like lactoylglutathione lyase family enzyme
MKLAWLVPALVLTTSGPPLAETVLAQSSGAAVKVRYIVTDVDAAVAFYTHNLGFELQAQAGPNFAMLSHGSLQLVLSPPSGPGSASKPGLEGRPPEPGGWNRIILESRDLAGEVDSLRRAGVRFRSTILSGPGGQQVLVEDPSGNPVELFQPAGN